MPPEATRSRSGCLTCRKRKKKCCEQWRPDGACERCYVGSFECVRAPLKVIGSVGNSGGGSNNKNKRPYMSSIPSMDTTTATALASLAAGVAATGIGGRDEPRIGGGLSGSSAESSTASLPDRSRKPSNPSTSTSTVNQTNIRQISPRREGTPSRTTATTTSTNVTSNATHNGRPGTPTSSHPASSRNPSRPRSPISSPELQTPAFIPSLPNFDRTSLGADLIAGDSSHQHLPGSGTDPFGYTKMNGHSDLLLSFFESLDEIADSNWDHLDVLVDNNALTSEDLTGEKMGKPRLEGSPSESTSTASLTTGGVNLNSRMEGVQESSGRSGRFEASWERTVVDDDPRPRDSYTATPHSSGGMDRRAMDDEEARRRSSAGRETTFSPEEQAGIAVTTETTVSPLYGAFNSGFFQSIPAPVRKIMVQQMNHVAVSSSLNRAASMAMVLLYRARSHPDGGTELQERLIAQSDLYFQQAVLHLQAPIPLEAQLVAILDLQSHQFDQSGAAAAYAIVLIGEFFVTESLGIRPSLNLATLFEPSSIALRCFAYTDVLRTVCLRRRRTIFDFKNLPGEPTDTSRGSEEYARDEATAVHTHLGLPGGILLCLAATSNLAVDAAGMDSEIVKTKAEMIENAIRVWRPAAPDASALVDSLAYLDVVVTQEMWRQAALIHLYQAVYRVGCLSQVIRLSLQQILQLGSRITQATPKDAADPVYEGAVRACPWFLAATVAFLPHERDQCRQGLKSCGPQRAYADNLDAAEKIWSLVDSGGWGVDWREVLEKEGKFVAFL